MPLNKSKSKAAFEQNVKTEIAAGKPPKQAVAIAYATKGEHHSSHSAKRSEHYHSKIIAPTKIQRGSMKMTQARGQQQNAEDQDEKGHDR
jgi:hypothetical protein